MKIKVAFYTGGEGWQHKIIRWWTKSIYSHAELVMPDNFTWISISPFLESKVAKRLKTDFDLEKFSRGKWVKVGKVPAHLAHFIISPKLLTKNLIREDGSKISLYGKYRLHFELGSNWQNSNEFYIKRKQ